MKHNKIKKTESSIKHLFIPVFKTKIKSQRELTK